MGANGSTLFGSIQPTENVSFTINGKPYIVKPDGIKIKLTTSLNSFIRNVAQLKGTKAMCLEGGCGSCVVTAEFEHPVTKRQTIVAVNSCLVTVLSCDGWKITTVEGIGNKKDGYNVIQKRLAQFNGTQCGFCSPGMVMNMYSLYQSEENGLTQKQVENSFGGNICRCTGYRSIADGFKTLTTDADQKLLAKCQDLEELNICSKTGTYCARECQKKNPNYIEQSTPRNYVYIRMDNEKWYKVFKLSELLEVLNGVGDEKYMLVGGNTAHGVRRRDTAIMVYIDVNSVEELHSLNISDTEIKLGASTSLTEAMKLFLKISNEKPKFAYLKEVYDHWDLIANVPVRNVGTIAGNLLLKHGYKRFQSDVFLTLETFGAKLTIVSKDGSAEKVVSPKEFLDMDMNGKVLVSVTLYPLEGNYVYQTYKIMPRAQNVHAIVNAGFCIKLGDDKNKVLEATIVYGAINVDFVHASETEKVLSGKNLYDDGTIQAVCLSLDSELKCDVAPPDPSPEARKKLAINLFYKFILNTAPENLLDPKYKSGGPKFDRPVSTGKQEYDTKKDTYPLTQPIPKVEALVQCSGEAKYMVDVDTSREDFTYTAFVLARAAPGSKIKSINSDDAKKLPGVVDVITSKDVPGRNIYTVPELLYSNNAQIFCDNEIKYNGQPAALVIAETEQIAQLAAKLVRLEYEAPPSDKKNTYTVRDALKIPNNPRIVLERQHDPTKKNTDAKHVLKGTFDIGSQYHYTMETQTCVCVPIEDGMDVYSSTQWMDYIQTAIAKSCNIPQKNVNLNVRRLGGGYGAKISQSSLIACATAVAATKLNRPVYSRMIIEDNMESIGKRYPCSADYEVGVDDNGKIQYMKISIWMNYGYIANEPNAKAVLEHVFNCYNTETWDIKAYGVTTDIANNTYCRAPSSTEGIALIESIMEHIAVKVGKDPQDIRTVNASEKDNPLPDLIKDFGLKAEIETRKKQIQEFNMNNRWKKRGIGVALMKYPFEFFGNFYSMVSIYTGDGTVSVCHGGIEMGQGINTKVQQVAAHVLGIDMDMVQIKPANTLTAPNNFVTGGSVGSESVCYATMKACQTLLERLEPVKKDMKEYNWLTMLQLSRRFGIDLNASHQFTIMDSVKNYNIYGVTFTEVEVDVLTGLAQINRVDLLEDTGESMSPEVDIGQVEGAFVMGIGYWLMEHIEYDETDGKLLNTRTWTYHPPGIKDIPIDWRVEFRKNAPNPVGVLRSKATGEPPLCMSVSVAFAIRNALFEVRKENDSSADPWFPIDGPTSTDYILLNSLLNYKDFKLK
ncbi:indole-3-acetaldehyde oxidase-like [Chrysoperla carnea]|uniref:indole-3-acetaldehyde oxidase-like n=1 Tax=Chrysoperla carnea TaxID=189513 RepID=UPI001D094E05|nr:indole-3-acetaldehyde oxidase-like [Chrysoperla carnea]